jgi:hypothetical protein
MQTFALALLAWTLLPIPFAILWCRGIVKRDR